MNQAPGKIIVLSAPSGTGKTTIVRWLLQQKLDLEFSVSATSRPPRSNEQDGKDYFFLSPDTFRRLIEEGAFLEWEEVYPNQFYGTLKSEVDSKLSNGKNMLFDVDVKGALHIKEQYGAQCLSIFIKPPSLDVLKQRLEKRGTDSPSIIEERLKKAAWELSFAPRFDVVILNDELEKAKKDCFLLISKFLQTP
jgi:guanylate kinase